MGATPWAAETILGNSIDGVPSSPRLETSPFAYVVGDSDYGIGGTAWAYLDATEAAIAEGGQLLAGNVEANPLDACRVLLLPV